MSPYLRNFQKAVTNYNAWYRMDAEFGGYAALVAKYEASAFLELLHYHWSQEF